MRQTQQSQRVRRWQQVAGGFSQSVVGRKNSGVDAASASAER